jgi:hypothetical protein
MRHGPALETASWSWTRSDRPRPRCRLAPPNGPLAAKHQIVFPAPGRSRRCGRIGDRTDTREIGIRPRSTTYRALHSSNPPGDRARIEGFHYRQRLHESPGYVGPLEFARWLNGSYPGVRSSLGSPARPIEIGAYMVPEPLKPIRHRCPSEYGN